MSQRDSEQKSVSSFWPPCDRAASGRLFGLSCSITLCSFSNQVLVQLYLFNNVNINTLDYPENKRCVRWKQRVLSQRDRLACRRGLGRHESRQHQTCDCASSKHVHWTRCDHACQADSQGVAPLAIIPSRCRVLPEICDFAV